MAELVQLDHTVINVRYQMDAAAERFGALGFDLTERGYHTLGSINHLMMFGTDYLELIGLPADAQGSQSGRPDIENAPLGINGLVFKTTDVDEMYAHLQAIGMAGDPPKSFSRPVKLPEGTSDACFRTVHVRHDTFAGGRVYFCEHGTPELVWRPEWQVHANGALAMPEFVVASGDHEREANNMATLLRANVAGTGDHLSVPLAGAAISFIAPDAYRARYGDLATSMTERSSIFGALVMRVKDLDSVRQIAQAAGVPTIDEATRVVVREDQFDSVIEFVA